jgi:FG-GAP-like repeat
MDRPDSTPEERKTWETSDKSIVFTELHAIAVVDMDGDGLRDIVTGKRWFSHGMEYPENDRDDPAVMAWFKLVRRSGGQVEFVPHIINNYVGLGTQIAVVDMNGDKRPDVLTAARKGAYVFLNGAKSTQVTSTR